jgi:D-alanyl-D-alanine carboxypeptidase
MIAVCALVLAGCTSPADADPDGREEIGTPFSGEITGRLDAALAEAMTLSGSSGAIAGVWAPWAGQWVVSPGAATIGGTAPLSTDMHFRIGDNTRSMTCTVLLRLVDEGVVKLSDPVSDYLERLSDIDGITLGQLCQNTSGLSDYAAGLAPYFVNNPTREWPPLEVLSAGLALNRLGEPGTTFGQSRTGLVLLGIALEAATNKDWPTLYRQYIFEPLGLSDTSFPGSGQFDLPAPHPHGYAPILTPAGQTVCETVKDETRQSPSSSWVAGGGVSTVPDLKVWVEALAEGSLLSEESVKDQWATVPMGGAPGWQAFGLGAQQVGPFRGDSGATPGYLSAMLSDPASGLTIVVMLNNSHAGAAFVQTLAQRLASIASTAPPVSGETAPALALPWTEAEMAAAIAATPVCPPPAVPAAAG